MSEAIPCKSCGHPVSGLYCTACGEKVLTPEDHTLKHYLGALLNAFTFADSKLWNTLKAVVLRPGELSAAYMDGRRVKYMRPVAFFFLANFVYFAAPLFETFNTSLHSQMHYLGHSRWVRAKVEEHLSTTGQTLAEFTALYEPASGNNAKLLLVAMVFALFIPMLIIFFRKRQYTSAYVTVAFEMMAFHLWVTTIALGLLFGLMIFSLRALDGSFAQIISDEHTKWPVLALHFWVTIGIGRRFFGCTWPGAVWRAAAMLFGLQLALSAYRLLLFAVTFWQVG
ncbi:MAG: DUF3667 domain-containing protein [Flavobacteriales bacterium]|nr:DUF3667 domain-containing protein [Flavobacteriales bacterium]